jgi:hypothetical protein
MIGRINKDDEGRLIVVYYRECIEDSEAVIPVSCRLMPGFEMLFKVGDSIEFELIEFAQEDGSFSSYARPYLTITPHITKVIDTNEDGEADMGDKLAAMSKTLRSQIYYRITNDGSSFGCGLAMRNAESIEELFDEFAIGFVEWVTINYPNQRKFLLKQGNLDGFYTTKELLEIYKKEKGL